MLRSPFARLFSRSDVKDAALAAYHRAVDQARLPIFYETQGVPDTLDGRFEMILLHIFLILHRIRKQEPTQDFGQALFDLLFGDMDRSLRELGVGDLSVGREVKAMAKAFYGRIDAYEAGLDGTGDLAGALKRNLYGTVAAPSEVALNWMADYLRGQRDVLSLQPLAGIAEGHVAFSVP